MTLSTGIELGSLRYRVTSLKSIDQSVSEWLTRIGKDKIDEKVQMLDATLFFQTKEPIVISHSINYQKLGEPDTCDFIWSEKSQFLGVTLYIWNDAIIWLIKTNKLRDSNKLPPRMRTFLCDLTGNIVANCVDDAQRMINDLSEALDALGLAFNVKKLKWMKLLP